MYLLRYFIITNFFKNHLLIYFLIERTFLNPTENILCKSLIENLSFHYLFIIKIIEKKKLEIFVLIYYIGIFKNFLLIFKLCFNLFGP